jgi:hypothetical protein
MKSFRMRKKGSIVVAEQSGLPSIKVVNPGLSESHNVQASHVRTYEDHKTLVNPERTTRSLLVSQPERSIRIPVPSIQLPPIIENKKWKHVRLKDLLTEEQGHVLLYLMNAQDWEEIWDFLEGLKVPLGAKGVVPGYLYYVLQSRFKEDVSHEEIMSRIEDDLDWNIGMKLKTVELNMISKIDAIKGLLMKNPSQKDFLEKQLRNVEHELMNLRKYKEVYISLDDDEKQKLETLSKQSPAGFAVVKGEGVSDVFDKVKKLSKLQGEVNKLDDKIQKDISELPEEFQRLSKALVDDISRGDNKARIFIDELKEQISSGSSWHALPTIGGRQRRPGRKRR